MKRFVMSVSEGMYQELEQERMLRRLETVQEVARNIISDYLRYKSGKNLGKPERKDQLLRSK
jgi:hypothetical protein